MGRKHLTFCYCRVKRMLAQIGLCRNCFSPSRIIEIRKETAMAHDMFNYFIFRDARLEGSLPAIPGTLITQTLDAATPLATAFSRLNASAAMYGKIKTLFVMCHGEGSGNAASDDDFWWRGGL